MRSIQGKRFGLIWNAWSDGTTVFKNASMKGLTWEAMVSAAESDPTVAARVKHFEYRVPLEFYDYEQDPDALNIRIHDPQAREAIRAHGLRLGEFMRSTGDFALPAYERLGLCR